MPDTPDSDAPETILAFDFGLRRIGVAVGQEVTRSASPLGTLQNGPDGPDWGGIEGLVAEWRPARLVVGMPLHTDGSPSELTREVRRFIAELALLGLPVSSVDERYTSLEAGERLKAARAAGERGRVRHGMIDSAAAVLIAERWFEQFDGPPGRESE